MKFDIVIKKRQRVLKQLEQRARVVFHLNKAHVPEDSNKQVLKRTLTSLDSSVLLDFDAGLQADFEDPGFVENLHRDMTRRRVLDLEADVRKLLYQYIKLRAKEAKLKAPIHLYEHGKRGLWFKVRKVLLWAGLVLIVFLSALALHSQIAYSLRFFFSFDFDAILTKVCGSRTILAAQLMLLVYISAAVLYANCRVEVRHWYLLERKSSTLSALLFYIL